MLQWLTKFNRIAVVECVEALESHDRQRLINILQASQASDYPRSVHAPLAPLQISNIVSSIFSSSLDNLTLFESGIGAMPQTASLLMAEREEPPLQTASKSELGLLRKLFNRCARGKRFLSRDDFMRFLHEEQHESHRTPADVLQLIRKFSFLNRRRDRDDCGAQQHSTVTRVSALRFKDFVSYMLSDANDGFERPHFESVYHDMTHPLSHYLISSSHNTYLMGNQFRSESSVDAYRIALQQGCKCIESEPPTRANRSDGLVL